MNVLEYLDTRAERRAKWRVGKSATEGSSFRAMVGLLAIVGSLAGFIALFFIEIPPRNENALMFAMGIVFGWGSAVIGSEYNASNTGRKVAESAIKRMDKAASGDRPGVQDVKVINPHDEPVPVEEPSAKGKAKP